MGWTDHATWLAVAVVPFANATAAEPPDPDGTISTIACYVALANDLTPLVDARASEAPAVRSQCGESVVTADDHDRNDKTTGASVPTMEPEPRPGQATTARALAPVNRDRARRPPAAATVNKCADVANIVGNLITQCFP